MRCCGFGRLRKDDPFRRRSSLRASTHGGVKVPQVEPERSPRKGSGSTARVRISSIAEVVQMDVEFIDASGAPLPSSGRLLMMAQHSLEKRKDQKPADEKTRSDPLTRERAPRSSPRRSADFVLSKGRADRASDSVDDEGVDWAALIAPPSENDPCAAPSLVGKRISAKDSGSGTLQTPMARNSARVPSLGSGLRSGLLHLKVEASSDAVYASGWKPTSLARRGSFTPRRSMSGSAAVAVSARRHAAKPECASEQKRVANLLKRLRRSYDARAQTLAAFEEMDSGDGGSSFVQQILAESNLEQASVLLSAIQFAHRERVLGPLTAAKTYLTADEVREVAATLGCAPYEVATKSFCTRSESEEP